ncbi:pentatricopeptide repeat-containing protein At2g41080-like [Actinidia eriantha]|uniref:pentatricopeptide repeat-containing protein At2g41080-like n=1 Tax=Actinidia eriantha TaxID=165200 RepID=UPI002590DC6F|nr:pentatricopeptide repeat-containing protein At2g41080-like [Actinidia eriantha]
MLNRNLVTWNAMIAGCVHNGVKINGLKLFYQMKCYEFCTPDEFNVATVLTGGAREQDLVLSVQIHGYAIVSGLESICVNPIGNMYFQCGEVSCAERVLSGIEENVISKLIKIRGYVFNQRYHDAINYVASENKITEIFEVDVTVFVPLLTACTELSLLKVGRQVHGLLITMFKSYCYDHSLEDDNANFSMKWGNLIYF